MLVCFTMSLRITMRLKELYTDLVMLDHAGTRSRASKQVP